MIRVLQARTGRLDPTNAYIREVPALGVGRVWDQLSTAASSDLSDLGLSTDAAARVAAGLAVFQARFERELARLVAYLAGLPGR